MRSPSSVAGASAPAVVVLQTVSPDYRQPVWRALVERTGGAAVVLAGTHYFDPTILTRHDDSSTLIPVRNRFLLRRGLLVQDLPLAFLLRAPAVIAELNPRILTTWVLLLLRRLLRRRTILWGHAFPHTGETASGERVRHMMRGLADTIVVYSELEREALSRRMPEQDIVVAPNALLAGRDMVPRPGTEEARDFIYVGRMVEEKRPDLLLSGFLEAMPSLSPGARLLMIGDGPLKESMQRRVAEEQATARVRFFGHTSGRQELQALYATALASVSPGYVGLSITQSLAFGVPMIIADKEPHSPEIEAARAAFNCVFFTARSASSLASALVEVERDADRWRERSGEIAQACRNDYSVEKLAERLVEACCPPDHRPNAADSAIAGRGVGKTSG
jgi:glycosyltransferase involved in cell wall biosynthesis